jgi:hypothetical protein
MQMEEIMSDYSTSQQENPRLAMRSDSFARRVASWSHSPETYYTLMFRDNKTYTFGAWKCEAACVCDFTMLKHVSDIARRDPAVPLTNSPTKLPVRP